MNLVWKLLRQHISVPQLIGFFFANLCGMAIVLLSVQFYEDVLPVFTQGDSFMKKDYVIVSKHISTIGTFTGKSNTFTQEDIDEVKNQPFSKAVGAFQPSEYKVSAGLAMEGTGLQMSTEMFFESVPDAFVDVTSHQWTYTPGSQDVPIIIPRNYLNLYNFGFAQSHNMPKISEGLMGMIHLNIQVRGTQGQETSFRGNIVGFSNRLNTILVPEKFMDWANKTYAPDTKAESSRLIVEVGNPADDRIAKFFQKKGYETEDNKLDAGKTTWFLKMTISIVMGVGLLISALSFYILMLSIYLLLQKNTVKLENLLLLGYSPSRVAAPYQLLTFGLNIFVLILAVVIVLWLRGYYLNVLTVLAPQMAHDSLTNMFITGGILFVLVSVLNIVAIRNKVISIWKHREK